MKQQHTLRAEVALSGVGLHTGQKVHLRLLPAAEGHGIKFQRSDLATPIIIAADASKVVATNRGTVIKQDEASISTIEHLLSALVAAQVDNVLIDIDGGEVPIMDGSAKPFLDAIQAVGTFAQQAEREVYEVLEPLHFKDEITGSEYWAYPSNHLAVTALIDFNSSVLSQQYADLNDMANYASEIAPARTFAFLHELESLLNAGLIKGGDLENAVILVDKILSPEALAELAQKLQKPNIKVEKQGVLNLSDLRFNNEPARHKLLDIIGDLALVGKPFNARIVATKPGHTSNVAFAKVLKKHFQDNRKLMGIPKYNADAVPLMDTIAIMKKLPHRYPFLLVDKVTEISTEHIVGIKNVTMDEACFQGHFPDNPVFPGVLQVEAMAQTGGILALYNTPDEEQWDTYFLKIDECKFKHKVVPGDTLIIKMELLEPIRRGIVKMQGSVYVGTKLASEGILTAQIAKRNQ